MLRETSQHRHYPPRYFLRVQGPQPYFLWTDLQNAPELSLYTLASNCLTSLPASWVCDIRLDYPYHPSLALTPKRTDYLLTHHTTRIYRSVQPLEPSSP